MERAFRDVAGSDAMVGAAASPEQLDLLRDATTGKLPANVFRIMREEERRVGRPKGAGNKRNEKLAKLICAKHGDPVQFMASVYSRPLDQIVELLRIADNSDEREQLLEGLVEQFQAQIAAIAASAPGVAALKRLDSIADRLIDIARVLQYKPGDLAVKALSLQVQAAKEVATYVHGKQPVTVDVRNKKDMVLIVPGLNAPIGMDPTALENEIRERGLDALDYENMTFLPRSETEEGEFEEVDDADDGQADG